MTPQDIEILHGEILSALSRAGDPGIPQPRLINELRLAGHTIDVAALEVQLRALGDRKLIASFTPSMVTRWRITELGKSKAAELGL